MAFYRQIEMSADLDKYYYNKIRTILRCHDSLFENFHPVYDPHCNRTGSDVLKQADVVLAINGNELNSYGQFIHPKYELLNYHDLITSKTVGEKVLFDLWRDGGKIQIRTEVKNFKASEMLENQIEMEKRMHGNTESITEIKSMQTENKMDA